MSYNSPRNYNPRRNSNHYNRPGSFIPASSTPRLQNHHTYEVQTPGGAAPAPAQLAAVPLPPSPQPNMPPPNTQPLMQMDNCLKDEDVDMPVGVGEESSGGSARAFFKNKLLGIKKISNKERRRRQNALLRRLTSPKNALMCINEMLPNEQVANQFKVEPAQHDSMYYNHNAHNFCAELALDGATYKGYGENKLSARNAAAEQAIRDIVLKKMERYSEAAAGAASANANATADENGAASSPMEEGGDEGAALPMIQLLSFALHKLFAEWEGAGHHVPQLRPNKPPQGYSEEEAQEAGAGAEGAGPAPGPAAAPKPPKAKKERKVPENAAAMHPAMLLTVLRPTASYREIGTEGDKPQNMMFTIGVDVDGETYIGKAPSKKEARKNAARAACKAVLDITFDDEKPAAN